MPKTVEIEQEEFANMPAASPLGRACRALMGVRDEMKETTEALDKREAAAKKKVLELLDEAGKEGIVVDGVTYRKVHKDASDEIRVLVTKGKKKKRASEDDEE